MILVLEISFPELSFPYHYYNLFNLLGKSRVTKVLFIAGSIYFKCFYVQGKFFGPLSILNSWSNNNIENAHFLQFSLMGEGMRGVLRN